MTQPQTTGRQPTRKRFLTIAAFCDAYGVRKTKAYSLLSSGAIMGSKSGSQTLIDWESAEAWADSLPLFRSGGAAAQRKRERTP